MSGEGTTISFRRLLAQQVERFLAEEGLAAVPAIPALCELIILLAQYREEGVALFPEVFVVDDLDAAIAHLDGIDRIAIGTTTLDADGVRLALKRTAPIGRAGWSIYLRVRADGCDCGVFRTDPFALAASAFDRLRARESSTLRILGVTQIEENVVELRSARGGFRHVFLSGARLDAEPGPVVIERFLRSVAAEAPLAVADAVRTFWRRALVDALRVSHGLLVTVVHEGTDVGRYFEDAAHLSPCIDVGAYVEWYLTRHDEPSRAAISAASSLVGGMLRADGITVLAPDGAVLAYNAFIAPRHGLVAGGARKRTYDALAADVGGPLCAALYRSQDGGAAVAIAPRVSG